jgi:hypothetical protein
MQLQPPDKHELTNWLKENKMGAQPVVVRPVLE